MAVARLAGNNVLSATIALPRIGAWVAKLEVDTHEALPAGLLELQLGRRILRGTVSRGAVVGGIWRGMLVAGADGLRTLVTPRHFTTPAVRVVLAQVLRDAGEQLAASSDPAVLGQLLEHWTLRRMPAGRALRALIGRAPPETTWRFLEDGTFWLGTETWPEADVGYVQTENDAAEGRIELALEEPFLLAGTAIEGRRTYAAELRLRRDEISATVWTAG